MIKIPKLTFLVVTVLCVFLANGCVTLNVNYDFYKDFKEQMPVVVLSMDYWNKNSHWPKNVEDLQALPEWNSWKDDWKVDDEHCSFSEDKDSNLILTFKEKDLGETTKLALTTQGKLLEIDLKDSLGFGTPQWQRELGQQ